ncbi:hypothetical protein MMC13_003487 [Lambiella insularis]|nr:hypothetical protein [Lambiella insularis]
MPSRNSNDINICYAKTFPFLLLPGELRNIIYALLLTPSLKPISPFLRRKPAPQHLTPSLLRVSRLLHVESAPFLYATTFRAHPSLLTSFPHHSDPSRPLTSSYYISLIRNWHIFIRLDCDPNWTKDQVTAAFSGMEALEVELWEASFGGAGTKVLEGFWDVRGVGQAKVSGMVQSKMARWLEGVMESPVRLIRKPSPAAVVVPPSSSHTPLTISRTLMPAARSQSRNCIDYKLDISK